ncbi:MAG TPA: hypothetical protein VMV19_14995 [Xanthobacteraceae bacterium]|nr:hypothetical protein [Xanthobacteraceae bacterium]
MPLILLLLGIVTTIAGAVLVVSSLSFHGGTFDIEAVTPGTVAAVGGLLLVGMGLAVRELQRIERALAARPMPRVNRAGDDSAVAAERTEPSVSLPFPSKPNTSLRAVDARSKPASADETAVEPLVKFPSLPGREEGPVAEEEAVEVKQPAAATVGRGANGVSPARVAPRFDIKPRAAAASDATRVSGLTAFLSGKSRRNGQVASLQVASLQVASTQIGSAQAASAQVTAALPQSAEKPALASEPESAPAMRPRGAVSVLKSGVVEGMAYTLYSDGSIEAQLPQGTLRFGSITALREHIDSGA